MNSSDHRWGNPGLFQLTKGSIMAEAPSAPGLYGLLCPPDRWIYIGDADSIRSALLAHMARIPSVASLVWFAYEVCPPDKREGRKQALIEAYAPVCNQEPGPASMCDSESQPLGAMDRVKNYLLKRPLLGLAMAVVLGVALGFVLSFF